MAPSDEREATTLEKWERKWRALLAALGAERRVARAAGDTETDTTLRDEIRDLRASPPKVRWRELEGSYEQRENDRRAGEAWKRLTADLSSTPLPSDERAAQLRQLLAQPVWPLRFAMYPYDKMGGPLLEDDLTLESLRQKLQAIEDDGSAKTHEREGMRRDALLKLGVVWPRATRWERDGLAFVGFLLLGCTETEALRRTADRRSCKTSTAERSVRRFFKKVGVRSLEVPRGY